MPAILAALLRVAAANPAHSQWHGAFWPWALASIALCVVTVRLLPTRFDRYRAPRLMGLALVLPLVLFLSTLATRTPTT